MLIKKEIKEKLVKRIKAEAEIFNRLTPEEQELIMRRTACMCKLEQEMREKIELHK